MNLTVKIEPTIVKFILLLLALMIRKSYGSVKSSYIILAPDIISPGQVLNVKVSIFNVSRPVWMKAGIMGYNNRLIANQSRSFQPESTRELAIKIPTSLNCHGSCWFFAKGHLPNGQRFHRKQSIRVRYKQMSIYIQTDKGIYKPGQTVHMRIFALFPDLTSYKGKMTVSILDPNRNKMVYWVNLQDPIGIIKKDFLLTTKTIMGNWRIIVKAGRDTNHRYFEVKQFVLPKFEVFLSLPPYMLRRDTKLIGQISSKYVYGKPVMGGVILDAYFVRGRRSIRRKFALNGTTTFIFDMNNIKELLHDTYTWASKEDLYRYWYKLTLNATVEDKLTGRTNSRHQTISFYQTDVALSFPPFNPKTFKPGLPFTVVLKVTKPNGQPHHPDYLANLIMHTVTKYKWNGNVTANVHHTTPKGVIVINNEVPIYADFVNIEASFRNGTRVFSRAWFSASKSVSPSSSYIKLSSTKPKVKPGEDIHCQITSSFPMETYMYLVLVRSNIRHIGSGVSLDYGHNGTFNITALRMMSPSARIVAYSITADGEVVVDSLVVAVENPFENKVSLEFSANTSRPGQEVKLSAKALSGSQVAFLAVDKRMLLMKKDNDISRSQVLRELQSFSTGSGLYPWWEWGWLVDCNFPFYTGGVDAHSVFKQSGLIVFSDGLVYRKPRWQFERFESPKNLETSIEDGQASGQVNHLERFFFPETWIWTDVIASSDGKAEITAKVPDTITSWITSAFAISPTAGFGISSLKSKLQVFQPFFVSIDLPYSVIRGEEVAIKVLVLNYLEEVQKVTVELEPSNDWLMVDMINDRSNNTGESMTLKEILTVPAGEGKVINFPIIPKKLGGVSITLQAQSNGAAEAVQRILFVEPEGIQREYSYSVLLDLNSTSFFTKNLPISLPKTLVDGSSHVKVTLIGDILGSSFNNLDSLLRMPFGCGEQNMINFAPNVFVLKYLTTVKKVTAEIKEKAERCMLQGYQREQTYRHRDGSYSAFGERDIEGSMWLTAFVVKSFIQARKYIYIDLNSLDLSVRWIVKNQNKDGSFPKLGYVHSSSLKGGLMGELSLTAFVALALSETRSSSKVVKGAKVKAVRYIERNLNVIMISKNKYALAIAAYVLKLEDSQYSYRALNALLSLAIHQDATMHWTNSKEKDDKSTSYRPFHRTKSADIEITAYALLTLSLYKDFKNGIPVLRWLSQQRNSLGGYLSTQDTVVGIQALSEFAALIYSHKMNLNVTITHSGITTFSRTMTVNERNGMVLQQVLIPKSEGILKVEATGHGVGLLQVGVTCHVTKAPSKSTFNFIVTNVKETSSHIETRACAQWKGVGESSSMAVIEMAILSGFTADEEQINKLIDDKRLALKRIDFQGKKVIFYFDQVYKRNTTCISVQFDRTYYIGKNKPALVTVYDYYRPENRAEALYSLDKTRDVSICQVCIICVGCQTGESTKLLPEQPLMKDTCSECKNKTEVIKLNSSPSLYARTYKISLVCLLALIWSSI